MEVLRGPQSGLYGSDAIGGVINIITKAAKGPLTLSAEAEGGSFDTFNQSATASGSDGCASITASRLAHLHAGATPVTPLELLLPGETRHDDYFDTVTASTKLGYDVTGQFRSGLRRPRQQQPGADHRRCLRSATFASFPSPDPDPHRHAEL